MSDDTIATFLAERPKLTGALFTIVLLLSQAGGVLAGGQATAGP